MSSDEIPDECAACGKSGEGLKKCVACKMVRYCHRGCQAAHRSAHKRACKKKAAELHDLALFTQPPKRAECPICFLMLPADAGDKYYQPCCGQVVCNGCIFTVQILEKTNACPFCRGHNRLVAQEMIEMYQRRVESNDAGAMNTLGSYYIQGQLGLARDPTKARELWEKAGKLGSASAYEQLARMYNEGDGVARDPKKAKHYWELGAMGGDVYARYNLGCLELESNIQNPFRAVKHFVIAAKDGHEGAMKDVTAMKELITTEEYKETLRAFVKVTKETKSEHREKAAEWGEIFKGEPDSADDETMERASRWMKANGQL